MCYQLSLDTHVGSVRDSFAKKVQLYSFAHKMSVQLNSCKRSATEEALFCCLLACKCPNAAAAASLGVAVARENQVALKSCQ